MFMYLFLFSDTLSCNSFGSHTILGDKSRQDYQTHFIEGKTEVREGLMNQQTLDICKITLE